MTTSAGRFRLRDFRADIDKIERSRAAASSEILSRYDEKTKNKLPENKTLTRDDERGAVWA